MFVWSRVIVKVPMLQLEDDLLGKGRGNIRCQGTNGPDLIGRLGGPLGSGFGIRSSPCLGLRNPLFIRRGDVSIKANNCVGGAPRLAFLTPLQP
jgi:hypothetical protein